MEGGKEREKVCVDIYIYIYDGVFFFVFYAIYSSWIERESDSERQKQHLILSTVEFRIPENSF